MKGNKPQPYHVVEVIAVNDLLMTLIAMRGMVVDITTRTGGHAAAAIYVDAYCDALTQVTTTVERMQKMKVMMP